MERWKVPGAKKAFVNPQEVVGVVPDVRGIIKLVLSNGESIDLAYDTPKEPRGSWGEEGYQEIYRQYVRECEVAEDAFLLEVRKWLEG